MNFLKRSLLSVKAKLGKSALLLVIFTVISVLILSGITIQSAAENASILARQKLGGDVTLFVDREAVMANLEQNSQGSRVRFEPVPLPLEGAEELTTSDLLKGYNFFSTTSALALNFEPVAEEIEESETTSADARPSGMSADVSIEGVEFTDSVDVFTDGTAELIEGSHLSEDGNGALIEQSLAEENDLTVGDTIEVTSVDETIIQELTIIGLYQTNEVNENMQGLSIPALDPVNAIYTHYSVASTLKGEQYTNAIDSAIYYISDPLFTEDFTNLTASVDTVDWELFNLSANDQLYEQMMGPIENVAAFSSNIVYLVTIAGSIILGLIVMMNIRDRKYEMGVLLSLGEKKWKLVGQFFTEVLIIAVLAFGIATVSGTYISGVIGEQLLSQEILESEAIVEPASFNRMAGGFQGGATLPAIQDVDVINTLDVSVTPKELGILGGIGFLIVMISTLLPSLTVLRLSPKTILSKQD
ncbi:macrolide ABC transporter permease [Bacillus coahuilensis p1.1.43]|uniref:Macrolide ABC transporter permease n=1 Tax=Bacillus coahuilensis p1.1.43 TaxID=1150625 RepID=A0A147KAN9_9BACI|nr:ABC transporter permease [Bacillus coahuilensis]KUP07860.1 macrolide ABC transporter permease [Bacillus coahuilensis p1.1.43]